MLLAQQPAIFVIKGNKLFAFQVEKFIIIISFCVDYFFHILKIWCRGSINQAFKTNSSYWKLMFINWFINKIGLISNLSYRSFKHRSKQDWKSPYQKYHSALAEMYLWKSDFAYSFGWDTNLETPISSQLLLQKLQKSALFVIFMTLDKFHLIFWFSTSRFAD